jgi:predicted Co/Zn/Cd cation transporter (cation efflux family)
MKMNYDSKLMKLVPGAVVVAVAAFLGGGQEKVNDFSVIYDLFGCAVVIALIAVAAIDYRQKLTDQSGR